ncbi:hypothetical protein PHYBOEH_006228 [Phytophthora boehmeriae]|uniref:Uncharacterized protein n=1 Tax=Phytophthora boehmeriae TaxID=109152 RepID=A0A8T1WME4_9STRA|nr:hypothetical protein PHYBOEH_006228 [Phytophthora boehmeriae]
MGLKQSALKKEINSLRNEARRSAAKHEEELAAATNDNRRLQLKVDELKDIATKAQLEVEKIKSELLQQEERMKVLKWELMELPLHAAIAALTYSEDGPFELLSNFYSRYPISSQLLDHQRRPPLFYALEQHWDLEILSWLVDKSLDTVMEKDTDGKAIVTQAIMNNCPEELTIRLAVAAASRCVNAVEELLSGQHYENARRVGLLGAG